jgi:hypothetical protein
MKSLSTPLAFSLLCFSSHMFSVSAATYKLADDYSGTTFFDHWDYYGKYDNLTLGDVNWVDKANATSKQLTYVNSAGNAILKVSTETVVYDNKRDAVRITTQKAYPVGTIWIVDAVHMPFGCSVWPAIWTKGQNWPDDGEIDILEGINLNTNNQIALHTRPGCTHVASPPNQLGKSLELDCSKDAGCTVQDPRVTSYGDGFNKAGGGIFATQFASDGIYIWFWSRASIPTSVTALSSSKSPITSLTDWGNPVASYPGGSNCDIPKAFTSQNLIIDITLCGVWGRDPQFYQPQCGTRGPTKGETACYVDNVLGNGTNYQEAYFELKYVRAYVDENAPTPSSTAGSPSSSSTARKPFGMSGVMSLVAAAIAFSSVAFLF